MEPRLKIGLIGCGAIAPAYMENLSGNLSGTVEVVACADLDQRLAAKLAETHGIPRTCSTEELLADPEITVAVNLTPAPAHFAVSKQILEAGKHLFSEKPLSLETEQAEELLAMARDRNLRVGGAADTFMGAGLQVARRLIEKRRIGDPVAAAALVTVPLREDRRYHEVFKGAVMDLGPYYITALVHLLGPITRVAGLAPLRFPTKTDAATGESFAVDLPSTASAVFEFAGGVTATFIASQDVHSYFPRIEVFGTSGRMTVNDANKYSGPITIESHQGNESIEPTSADGFTNDRRGLGVAEMALALEKGQEPLASGALMTHVLEVQRAVFRTAETGTAVEITSSIEGLRLLTREELDQMRNGIT